MIGCPYCAAPTHAYATVPAELAEDLRPLCREYRMLISFLHQHRFLPTRRVDPATRRRG